MDQAAVEVMEQVCNANGVKYITGEIIRSDWHNLIDYGKPNWRGTISMRDKISCSSSSCSLNCNQISSCQGVALIESIWMIDCKETSTCQSLEATCTPGKTCFAKCSGISSCQGAVWTGNWFIECSGPSSC